MVEQEAPQRLGAEVLSLDLNKAVTWAPMDEGPQSQQEPQSPAARQEA
jgi:hypothetical protein